MNLLLDTHALLWWLIDSPRLGPAARAGISEPRNTVWVSAVSAWEIAIKAGVGRLDLSERLAERLLDLEREGFRELPVGVDHALGVRDLPLHHGDPFDRLLIAQALAASLTIVTADAAFAGYASPTLAADR